MAILTYWNFHKGVSTHTGLLKDRKRRRIRSGGLLRHLSSTRRFLFVTVAGIYAVVSSIAFAQQFREVTTEVGLIPEAKKSWGNPIWGDVNNDGFVDLIVPTHGLRSSGGPFVYLNNGGTAFIDIRTTSGIQRNNPDSSDWHGFAFGDYDGDGNLDVFIAEGSKKGGKRVSDELFRGLGDGTFQYTSRTAGILIGTDRGRCPFWVDYDNDGKLDLFVKNQFNVNRLYKNNGNGAFTEVSDAAGLALATIGRDQGTTCSFADYDNDGFMDVFFAGDGMPGSVPTDALFRNQGGNFIDVTAAAGFTPLSSGHGIAWGDYNNDGLLDLYVARIGSKVGAAAARLYRNNGDGTFSDVTQEAGLRTDANTQSAVWGDYDNDGFLDLFVTNSGTELVGLGNANLLYHNNGDGTFTDMAAAEGVQLEDNSSAHKGAAWADYDNDGFLDLIIKDGVGNEGDNGDTALGLHRLFKNNGHSNHFIELRLQGVQSNIGGIGARATATYASGIAFRENNGGGGGDNASQGSQPLHFGIGAAKSATVQVIWPSGVVDTLFSVPANSILTLVEGTAP